LRALLRRKPAVELVDEECEPGVFDGEFASTEVDLRAAPAPSRNLVVIVFLA
jgi:hypothetical protein